MSSWNCITDLKFSARCRVRPVRADTVEFQDLSENERMSWGQAVTPDGKEKDYTSKEQGEVLNFVLQRKDVSKVQAS